MKCFCHSMRFALFFGLVLPFGLMAKDPLPAKGKIDVALAYLQSGAVPSLRIELEPAAAEALRADARAYVKCRLTEDGKTVYADVAIKLKGAAGSFRDLDDRPAFTLNMDRHVDGQSFHGLDKFHLNNSVQDESYLNEWICSELFNQAGVPAPRVGHARVWLNDRDLGLYVLKEGFDKNLLKRHFPNAKGNLYDGGFIKEIDGDLDLDEGKGVQDRSDLAALASACKLEDPAERFPKVAELLNVDAFLTFMAMERMTCHWDGYCLNRNNYRVYFDPGDGNRARFLPHGMDQMFGDSGASILSPPAALVASTVLQNPEWRAQYRERVKSLLPLFDPSDSLAKRARAVAERLAPVLKAMGEDKANAHRDRVNETVERLAARAAHLREEADAPEPEPLLFNEKGWVKIENWQARSGEGESSLEETQEDGQPHLYRIACGENERTIASWRTSVLLAPGTYTLSARVKAKGLAPITDEKGSGAGVRISGEARTNKKESGTGWTTLRHEFSIQDQRDVELVAELRAAKGEVWFDADSLRLERKP